MMLAKKAKKEIIESFKQVIPAHERELVTISSLQGSFKIEALVLLDFLDSVE